LFAEDRKSQRLHRREHPDGAASRFTLSYGIHNKSINNNNNNKKKVMSNLTTIPQTV